MNKRFSSEQLLERWEERREIQNTMVRFMTQDYMFRREKDMYDKYWTKAQDVCLGVNEGYYKGAEAVKSYYKGIDERTKLESKLIQKRYPTRLGNLSDEEIYGVGIMDFKPLDTPVIEIAGDGKTAKAMYSIRGANTKLTAGGHVSYWEWAWVCADLVKEDEDWKIWHLLYVKDLDVPTGINWADPAPEYPEDPVFAPIKDFKFPEPNIKRTVREYYHTDRAFTPPPEYPEPYETFAETFSYGI